MNETTYSACPRRAALAGLAALLVHLAVDWRYPLPSTFLKYTEAARRLNEGSLLGERWMDFSPLYLLIAQAMDRVSSTPVVWLELLHSVWIAAAVGGLWWLCARRVGPWLATAVVAAFTVDRHLLTYGRVLEPEALLLACAVGLLVAADARRPWLAGCLGAVGIAARPTLLPLVALLPFVLLRGKSWGPLRFAGDNRPRVSPRAAAGTLAGALVPTIAVLGLLALRAFWATGDARAPSMNPGTVFFEGNHALSLGTSAVYPPSLFLALPHRVDEPDVAHALYRDIARAASPRWDPGASSPTPRVDLPIGPRQVNAFWSSLAVASLRERPAEGVARWFGKLRRALHGYRWHDVPHIATLDRALRVPGVPFALVAALALAGMLAAARSWRTHLLAYGLFASQLGVMVAFYVSARQRILLLPALYLFTALAVHALRQAPSRRRRAAIALVALLTLAFSLPDDAQRDDAYQEAGVPRADAAFAQLARSLDGRTLAEGPPEAIEGLAAVPWKLDSLQPAYFPRERQPLERQIAQRIVQQGIDERGLAGLSASARFDVGALRLRGGDFAGAREALEPLASEGRVVYRGTTQPSDPRILLARLDALEGRTDEALERLEAVLADRPGDAFALAERIALLPADETSADLAELRRAWSAPDIAWFLGRAFLTHGRPADAARVLEPLARRLSDAIPARKAWAVALGESGRLDEAIGVLQAAIADAPEPLVEPERTAMVIEAWAAQAPAARSAEAARLLRIHGFPERAEQLARTAEGP